MPLLAGIGGGMLELLGPESCAHCGAARDGRPWCRRGPRVRGLRVWDAPHLCLACAAALHGEPLVRRLTVPDVPAGGIPVWAAGPTSAGLVDVVAAWKYRGLRGLAWPLATLALPAAVGVGRGVTGRGLLAPVPLHRRRHRHRGFNQAAVLAALLGRALGWRTDPGVLVRRRPTAQQARLDLDDIRYRNLAGSCAARPPRPDQEGTPVVVVDDIVTSGATVTEAVRALAAAGWRPCAVVTLGARASASG